MSPLIKTSVAVLVACLSPTASTALAASPAPAATPDKPARPDAAAARRKTLMAEATSAIAETRTTVQKWVTKNGITCLQTRNYVTCIRTP